MVFDINCQMLEDLQFIFVSALNNIVDIGGVGMKTFKDCRKTLETLIQRANKH